MSGGSAGWVVVRGMQVRMRALLQVVVAWACGGDAASARTDAEALGGLRDLGRSLQLRPPIFPIS